MTLKELVKYRNLLESILADNEVNQPVFHELAKFNSKINSAKIDFKDIKQNMFSTQEKLQENLHDLYTDLNRFIDELNKQIANHEPSYHKKSEKIWLADSKKSMETKEHSYNYGHLFINPPYQKAEESIPKQAFVGAMLKYVNFKWPGLEIGPITGELTKNLVSLDPLYLGDNSKDRFSKIKQLWNPQYQRRLRYYVFNDSAENPLRALPANQLGFIVSVDWFNFKPQKIIHKYVKSAFDILSPGGVMLFTYNNCNYPKAIDKVDEMHYTYTNGHTLKEFCKSAGFEIVSSYDGEKEIDWYVSWLEIKKPGELTSLRGGQNVALINKLWS